MSIEVLQKNGLAGSLMFVKNAGDTGFAVIDVETEEFIKHVGEGEYPHKATFHPNGKWTYLSFIVRSTIEVVNLQTLETEYVEKGIAKGSVGVNLSRDGRYLFIGSYGEIPGENLPGIMVFDTQWGEKPELLLKAKIPLGKCGGLVVDSKNDLWVAVSDQNKVVQISGYPPFEIKQEIPVGKHPHDMVFCKELQMLQVNHADEKFVTFIDVLNNRQIANVPTGYNPHGGKFVIRDGSIKCFVPSRKENIASVIDIQKASLIRTIDLGTPQGFVDVTKDGQYVIFDAYKGNCVSIVDTETYEVVRRVAVGEMPMHPQITHDGSKCFVDSMGEGTISVLDIRPLYDGNPDGVYVRKTIKNVGIKPSGNFFSYRGYLL
ncbi:hypothetical protein L1765_01540 [Microaerobacter geothermalis]|uniref:cytochrome D1 domain-containing protein n=1 Tax=Microaerobacter geothermalis TaxID=674972 RepID=UPI001F25B3AD|nr:cytochrome D1 domain-containing protein [Microaerobacter geothermalis]MCF6092675.1 hypothetical protein [Microaerobacter geothermalis]